MLPAEEEQDPAHLFQFLHCKQVSFLQFTRTLEGVHEGSGMGGREEKQKIALELDIWGPGYLGVLT